MADLFNILSPSLTNNKTAKSRFVYQIGQDFFHIEIWLYNFLSGFAPVQLPFNFIEELNIEETLYDWNTKGSLVLRNDQEMWERGSNDYNTNGIESNLGSVKGPMLLRSDNRNRLSVKIFSYTEENESLEKTLPQEWQMNFDFIIYDIEDVTDPSNPMAKLKKLYFQDERYSILNERNIEWSTSMRSPLNALDVDRCMSGNEAIPSLLETVARAYSTDGSYLKVGFDDTGFVDKPNIPFQYIDKFNWDVGSAEINSKIFYSSTAFSTALQDLNYLLSYSKSSDGFPVLLRYGRNTSTKGWKLLSLSHFFKNSENNQIEKMLIADGADPSDSTPSIERSFYNPNEVSHVKNFTSGTASIIKNYYFAPMSPLDDLDIKNTPLFNYNFSTGEYKVYFKENTILNTLNQAKKLAKAGLYSAQKNSDPQILFNLNSTKTKGLATNNLLITQNSFPTDLSSLNALKKLVFLNQTVNFQVNGLTFRTPGKFIYIDRLSYSYNSFDDRFLGQWMIIKVRHTFTPKNYTNDIVCTKMDSMSKLWNEKDTTY